MAVMEKLCKKHIQAVTPSLWKNCIKHTKNIEEDYWEKDQLIEDIPTVEPIVINLSSDSMDEEESDFSDYEL